MGKGAPANGSIYVCNLPEGTDKNMLVDYFGTIGLIKVTRLSKCVFFVILDLNSCMHMEIGLHFCSSFLNDRFFKFCFLGDFTLQKEKKLVDQRYGYTVIK